MKKSLSVVFTLLIALLIFVSCDEAPPKEYDPKTIPFTMEFYDMGGYVIFNNAPDSLRYSIDGGELKKLETSHLLVGDCQKLTIYAARPMTSEDKLFSIDCLADCYIYGNIMSLVAGESFKNRATVHANAFRGLFKNNRYIDIHPIYDLYLPATTLSENCYYEMFSGCDNLTRIPELPAEQLADNCYAYMFAGCTALEEVPDLTCMNLAKGCYCGMFSGCTGLKEAPELFAEEMKDSCYESMFQNCSGLTKAPILRAETLATDSYKGIFAGCGKLNSIINLAIHPGSNMDDWAKDVAATGTIYVAEGTIPNWSYSNYVPANWQLAEYKEPNL